MNNCSIIPQIEVDGRLVDSKLFTDLLSVTDNNRDFAKRIYILAKQSSNLELDENGEPTVEEAIKLNELESEFYTREEAYNDLKPLKTNADILNYAMNKTNDPTLKMVAQKLLDNVKKINLVNFRFTSVSGDALGRYNNNTGEMQLNVADILSMPKREFLGTIVHEYVHAFTMNALNKPKTEAEKEFYKKIANAFNALKHNKIKNNYGLTNQFEFAAELLTNRKFVDDLRDAQPTLLQKILNYIKELFGIDTTLNLDDLLIFSANFMDRATPKITPGATYTYLERKREGVVEEINTYATQRIEALGNIKAKEKFMLQVHKKIKFNIGKINKKIADIQKEIKRLEVDHKKEIQKIIDDYVQYRGGIFDEGYKASPLYKTAVLNYTNTLTPLLAEQDILIKERVELSAKLVDLEATPDITVFEANYIALASDELLAITDRIGKYDLDNPAGQKQLAEDYLFTTLITKTHEITRLQESASALTTELLENISKYISTISDQYLNTSGLGDNIKIDVESILQTNDDIIQLGKIFEGFGDYPRLEAQLIHNITMTGKEKARLASLNTGQKIVDHMKELQSWAKRNKLTNVLGQGSIRKAYARLVAVNHLNRLDLVKPFTNSYYNEVNNQFRIAYGPDSKPAVVGGTLTPAQETKIKSAKRWLALNYYEKPKSGPYINNSYTYIQNQPELKSFYDFFKETMKDNYSKLPDYITLKNEEKIPAMIRNSFWEFFSMRKDNIFKSTLLALKTILIGQGRAEFYDEAGNPRSKFELSELSSDEMKLRMIGEIRADIKSFDLGHVLFEFTAFANDYTEMMEVLPKVRMIQNIVETKEYNRNTINSAFGKKKETIQGGQSRMYDAINMYTAGKILGKEESPKWRIGGGLIYDTDDNVIGRKSYYVSDIVRSLIKYTRVLQLGYNPFSGINNILAGLMGDMIEASGGKFFSKTQLLQAISIYTSNTLTKGKDDLNGNKQSSKLALVSEYLQPLEEIGEWQDKRKLTLGSPTLAGKALETFTSKAFIFQEAGEDFVQKITMIAYLLNKKTPEGKSYWNMMDVDNGELVYKTENNFDTKEEILKSRNTILDINHAIHGNYSKDNASVYDGALLFDSALVFKKWMPYMVRNRFMAQRYNFRTGNIDEGFYRGGMRAIQKTFNNMLVYFERQFKDTQNLVLNKQELTPLDIIGIKKVIAETIMFLTFATLSKILMPPPDDEKDSPYIMNWWEHMNISIWDSERQFENLEGASSMLIKSMINSTNRLSSEAMQMYQPAFYAETYQRWALWSTLVEGWDVLRESFKLITAESIDDPDLRYKSGPRKNELRLHKEVVDIIPYYKQVERAKQNGKKTIEELNK